MVGEDVETFCCRKIEKNRASPSVTCLFSSTWAEQDSSGCVTCSGDPATSAACTEPSCHIRQSLVVCTSALQWVQETFCWCCPFLPWEHGLSSIPAYSRHGKQHFKYSLLGKPCCPSGWGIISHHSNLFGVLIKYLILLHHLTIAAGKVVFSHHAHGAPITETHYSSMQPGGEHTVCFCSLGRTTARSHREHKPATTAVVWEAAQLSSRFTWQQALLLCCCKWNQPSWVSCMTARNKHL